VPALPVVLVADDSRSIRSWLARHLDAHFTLVEACDGAEAVRLARTSRPDVVLLDVDMPVLDGHQALAAMRADGELADIPVVFLTGRSTTGDVVEGLALGAVDYLRKPCEPEELIARVRGALRLKERQDALRDENAALEAASATDELTGLGNRRALTARLAGLLADGRRAGQPVAVLVVDIDHFKRVNDTEGHLVGDEVLRGVASRLRSSVRDDQVLARWGGEEFVVASPASVAERLRAVIAWEPVRVPGGRGIPVTVSIGYAAGLADADVLLRDADTALYTAKATGRDRCVGSVDGELAWHGAG
jgi:two-component system, cell cycle response regulator